MAAKKPAARGRRQEGVRRRQQILEATLRLIAREGIRAVRHRAVAAEAEVPLAATTYYFKDIGELLRDAFVYFAEQRAGAVAAVRGVIVERLQQGRATTGSELQRTEALAAQLSAALAEHILGQAAAADDRAIELAFRHEARRDEGLHQLNLDQERQFCEVIATLLADAGSSDPASDAQITLGVIYRLEAEAALGDMPADEVKRVVARHLRHMLGLVQRAPWPAPQGSVKK